MDDIFLSTYVVQLSLNTIFALVHGVQVPCKLCVLCKEHDELVQHIFFECNVSNVAWYMQ